MCTKIPDRDQIDGWSLQETLVYGRDGLQFHSNDKVELINRRNVLLTSPFGDTNAVLREVVTLSLEAEDMTTVKKVVGWLEEAGDPAMGYHVYIRLKRKRQKREAIEYLESAARGGHLLAQHANLLRIIDTKSRLLKILVSPAIKLYFIFRIALAAFRNAKDLRLK